MAGKTIYTGDMIAALETKIDTMVTTLQAHTTALGNINTAVAQGVSAPNIEASNVAKLSLAAEFSNAGSTSYVAFKKFKMLANGSIRFKANVFITTAAGVARTITLSYTKDAGTTYIPIGTFQCPGTSGAKWPGVITPEDIDVAFGDTIWLAVKVESATNVTAMGVGVSDLVNYTLKDVINGGAYSEIAL